MLAALEPALLERLWFPLGERTKAETRAQALAAGLTAASRPESQEACFLGGDDYRAFLERSGLDTTEGQIVDETGATLGTHRGYWRFTPGQRRGLGVSGRPRAATRLRAGAPRSRRHARRCQAPPPLPGRARLRGRDGGRLRAAPRRAGLRGRPRPGGRALRGGNRCRLRGDYRRYLTNCLHREAWRICG